MSNEESPLLVYYSVLCYIYRMTIEQTIEVPPSHRIFLDLPPELPVGKAKVELIFTPLSDTPQKSSGKIRLTKQMIDEMLQNSPITLALTGILHTDMTVEEIREERLAKYL
jgi:hypothetical protein